MFWDFDISRGHNQLAFCFDCSLRLYKHQGIVRVFESKAVADVAVKKPSKGL